MGSSVRKTSAKIKKLLKESIELNPALDCKEIIPKVAEETMRSKKTKCYFGDKDFAILAGGGFACFKKVKEIGIDTFLQQYDILDKKPTVIEVQKIIESILNKIEDENGEISSLLILSAFQSSMTKMLLNTMTEPEEFLKIFCETFITMVIREDASEELCAAFNETSMDELDKNIALFSHIYVHDKFKDLISECNKGSLHIDELIQRLQDILTGK